MDGIGDFWTSQESGGSDFDYGFYNSVPWMIAKTVLATLLMTTAYLLFALHELPWSLFGSALGLVLLAIAPFFAGVMLGFSFENQKWALGFSLLLGFVSIGLCMSFMMLPKWLGLAEYGPGFMTNVWYYGLVVPFIVTISFVPAGAMLSASTNVYD